MAKRQEAAKAKKTAVSPKKPTEVKGKPKSAAKAAPLKAKPPVTKKPAPPKKAVATKKAVAAKKPATQAKPARSTARTATPPKKAKSAVPAPKKKSAPAPKKAVAPAKLVKKAPPADPKTKKVAVVVPVKAPAKQAPVKGKTPPPPKKAAAAAPKKPAAPTKATIKPAAKQAGKPPVKVEKQPAKTAKTAPQTVKTAAPPPKAPAAKPKETAPAPAPARKEKMVPPIPVSFLVELAQNIKEAVEESARAVKGREVVSHAESGDVTFQLDKIAEKALLTFLKRAGKPVAYYSEDAGYSTFTSEKPKHLLVVDPIDGSRAAKSGFEGCVVAVASTRVIERPTMADVDNAVVLELLGDRCFQAERGKGVKITAGGQPRRPKLSANTELRTMIWSMTVPGRPAELVFPTVARLIDHSSLEGGFFACNSTAYSLTRLLTNQLDACVDIANRYHRDIPDKVQRLFENAGQGKVIGIAPYDLAAALLVAQEAGCVVTDAYGKSFDGVLLLDSSAGNHLSLVAAANKGLHAKLMEFLGRRIEMLESRFRALPTS